MAVITRPSYPFPFRYSTIKQDGEAPIMPESLRIEATPPQVHQYFNGLEKHMEQEKEKISALSGLESDRLNYRFEVNAYLHKKFVTAATKFGAKLKNKTSRFTLISSQNDSYEYELERIKRSLASKGPKFTVQRIPSSLKEESKYQQEPLTADQLFHIRSKFILDGTPMFPNRHYYAVRAPSRTSLEKRFESFTRKERRVLAVKTWLKGEILHLAAVVESELGLNESPRIVLSGLPHYLFL